MVNIIERDGIFILESEFDIKIDNNRKIYVKKKGDTTFKQIGMLDYGYSSEEKKKYIYNLYKQLMERKSELEEKKQQTQKEEVFE